jgi:aromatic-L-amino-acid decarboxylase
MAPTPFSTVCLRAHPKGVDDEAQLDTLNERILERINASGRFFLSHTKLNGKYTLRVAVGNLRTTEHVVRELWNEMQAILSEEMSELV